MSEITMKAARANLGLTQAEMAERLDVADSTYLKWEKGIHSMPADKFFLFCEICGCSRDAIKL